MKKLFLLEFADDLGPEWMNEINLLTCIDNQCKPGLCKVTELAFVDTGEQDRDNFI